MSKFDYRAPAELFPSRNRKAKQLVKYRRFDTAADAIQFSMEELPAPALLGAVIPIHGGGVGHPDIFQPYQRPDSPLQRQAKKRASAPAPPPRPLNPWPHLFPLLRP